MLNSAEEFHQSGYLVIRNLLDLKQAAALYDYTLKNMASGNMKDEQVPGSPAFYQDKELVNLHQTFLPRLRELTQLPLVPTFCYYRTYRTGAILRAHKDRSACEIAISLNLGQQGNLWDLWLLDHDENAHNITLAPGDALLYRGRQLSHWRGKLIHADYVSQAFFFFVDKSSRSRFALQTELLNQLLKRVRKLFGRAY